MQWLVLVAAVTVVYRWRGKRWWDAFIWAAFTVLAAWAVVVGVAILAGA